jgi:SdrD B-like protein
VPPGFYRVVAADPPGVVSVAAFGGPNGVAIDASTIQVSVAAGFDSGGNNFLDRAIAPPPSGLNTISGFVIRDVNVDSVPNNELGLSGALVTLQSSFGTPIASVVTDVTGAFSFGGLANGTYTITVTPPPGLANTNAIPSLGGVRLSAAAISLTTQLGITSYPGQLFLAGP